MRIAEFKLKLSERPEELEGKVLLLGTAKETVTDFKFQAVYCYGCRYSANFILSYFLHIEGYNFLETSFLWLNEKNHLISNNC
jgi:hypothetical protein